MKTLKFRSIFNIVDHVPSKRSPVYNCYDNKLLSQFDADDFAEFVFDNCDSEMNPRWDQKHFLYQIEMLDYIPKNYPRVYLYGVGDVIKGAIKINKK
jgi:hypothetical protein